MQCKLQRIKMITLYNKIDSNISSQCQARQSTSIHAELALLRNLVKKNQQSTHPSNSFFKNKEHEQPPRKASKKSLNKTAYYLRRTSLHDSERQEQLASSISSGKLLEIYSFSKLRTRSEQGNRSERLDRAYHENSNFIPLGKIYNQLRHKTERSIEPENKVQQAQLNPSLIVKDKIQEKKRFSIYAKQSNSVQRKALRQQNKTERRSFELGPMADLMIKESLQAPSPW